MIRSSAFNYVDVLNKAADASWTRNEVIGNNIANVDTPGYKRKDVHFDSYLLSEIARNGNSNNGISQARLNSLNPTIYTDNSALSYRLDGNNVNIDTESSNLAQNQIRYYTLIDSMTQEFNRIKTVLNAK
ncbi:MAG TPA: flagellar basal body rod protein FlgB [Clostridiales bacterium]|nr:flagellar basal body rod protein FlgB [Clostridiales bacterium]